MNGAVGAIASHRSHLMRKMSVHSLPELGRVADKLKLASEKT